MSPTGALTVVKSFDTVIVVVTVDVPGGSVVGLADTVALIGRPTRNGASEFLPGSVVPSLARSDTSSVYTPVIKLEVSIVPRLNVTALAVGASVIDTSGGVATTTLAELKTWICTSTLREALAVLKIEAL